MLNKFAVVWGFLVEPSYLYMYVLLDVLFVNSQAQDPLFKSKSLEIEQDWNLFDFFQDLTKDPPNWNFLFFFFFSHNQTPSNFVLIGK